MEQVPRRRGILREIYEANVERWTSGQTKGKRNVLGVLVDAVDYSAAQGRSCRRPTTDDPTR